MNRIPVAVEPARSFDQKVSEILDTVVRMADGGASYREITHSVFSAGGLAPLFFASPEDRAAFCSRPEYARSREVLSKVLAGEIRRAMEIHEQFFQGQAGGDGNP